MGGMMNAKRYTGCRCCVDPDDVARRQIEKREWRKEVEEEARPDECCGVCPPIKGGGYDCTCKDNSRCTKSSAVK